MSKKNAIRKVIKCPICNTETFNTVGQCKCGYKFPYDPIQDEMVVDICSNCRQIKQYRNGEHIGGDYTICPLCKNGILTTLSSANKWIKMSEEDKKKIVATVKEQKLNNNKRTTIECPYCHSTNTKKITTTSKVLNTAIWGFFGTKRFKEWHCNECGSDF